MVRDVVYLVRYGEANDELRYSLRSVAANLPHSRVWMVGAKPSWVQGVGFVAGNKTGEYRANVWDNIRRMSLCDRMSDEVVLFNDDFYVTTPVAEVPIHYWGLLAEHAKRISSPVPNDWYTRSLEATLRLLRERGVTNPLSYELHVPFVVDRERMAELVGSSQIPRNPPQLRSLYGNLCAIGGTAFRDVKRDVSKDRRPKVPRPFYSTDDLYFPHVRPLLDELFPDLCRYESR